VGLLERVQHGREGIGVGITLMLIIILIRWSKAWVLDLFVCHQIKGIRLIHINIRFYATSVSISRCNMSVTVAPYRWDH
jgi:hypothetical protein